MTTKSILLVEDNPQDELLTLRALRKALVANPIDVARDGQEALDYLFSRAQDEQGEGSRLPAVVLLDLNLPRLSGLEVLDRLRADPRTQQLPVVILTSSDEDADRIGCYRGGANSFVRKPVEFAAFMENVGRLGIYWMLVNEPPK